MADTTFRCRLITPQAQVLDEAVVYASVPAWDGLFGVLPNRAPIVAKLGLGELRLKFPDRAGAQGGERSFLVEDGFVHMVGNKLTILTQIAIPTETLVASEAQAELAAAERKTVPASAADRVAATAALDAERRRARLKVRLSGSGKI